ncbi:MAG: SDR family oxidoreductase [Phycisphaerae bacterium]|nr:SDR family oxidoreductase [Phycisphaerae bacterium]
MIELRDRPIAITGASSGIGLATALACARAGMPVALAARRADRLDDAVRTIQAAGGRAIAVACNVDTPGDPERLIASTIKAFGGIYAVFANAGYGLDRAMHECSDADVRAIFETNFFGCLATIRPALAPMLAARRGHVLVCSSCLAKMGTPFHGAYSATKAAQDHVARAMRIELAGTGVFVSSVHPIGTRTELFDLMEARSGQKRALRSPVSLMQPPERVAHAIVRCLRRPRGEVWTSAPARWAFALSGLFPTLTDAILRRATRPRRG